MRRFFLFISVLCWDYSDKVSRWVAYPLDKSYLGNVKKYDGWRYDPLVPAAKQPFLPHGYEVVHLQKKNWR